MALVDNNERTKDTIGSSRDANQQYYRRAHRLPSSVSVHMCSLSSFTGTVVVQHDVLFVSLSRHFRSCYIAHILCWLEGWHELNY